MDVKHGSLAASEGPVDAGKKEEPSLWSGLRDRAVNWKRQVTIRYSVLIFDEHWFGFVIQVVLSPVIWMLVAAIPFTVISTILCRAPEYAPVQDSGFWSALSQATAGLAGFVAILNSLRRPKKQQRRSWGKPQEYEWRIDSNFPRTFVVLLATSGLAGVTSALVYPFQPPSSLVLAFLATLGQTLATSLLVQDSMQQISELEHIVSEHGP